MELTYYDIRPKDEAVAGKRREKSEKRTLKDKDSAADLAAVNGPRGLAGPRQPKPLKRRPLPSDPTRPTLQESHSAPLPMARQGDSTDTPADVPEIKPLQTKRSQYPFSPDDYGSVVEPTPDPHSWADQLSQPLEQPQPRPLPHQRHNSVPVTVPQSDSRYNLPSVPSRGRDAQYSNQFASSPPSMRGSPIEADASSWSNGNISPIRQETFRDSPLRQSISHSDLDPRYETMQPTVEDDADEAPPPPPPPVHRNTYDGMTPPRSRHGKSVEPVPISERASPERRLPPQPQPSPPQQQEYTAYSPEFAPREPLPNHNHSVVSANSDYDLRPRAYSQEAMQDPNKSFVPPSLVAGYDPGIADDETERMVHENRADRRYSTGPPPIPVQSQIAQRRDPYGMPPQQPSPGYGGNHYDDGMRRHSRSPAPISRVNTEPQMGMQLHGGSPSPHSPYGGRHDPYDESVYPSIEDRPRRRSPAPPMPRPSYGGNAYGPNSPMDSNGVGEYGRSPVNDRGMHRSPGSMARSVSPAPSGMSSMRRSVSPRPPGSSYGGEPVRRLSSTPFSPDSYDTAFTPPKPPSSIILPAPTYETPEEQAEAARQREVQKLREIGPIIGNDGREIDPSDHLPCDTWAPEPERKGRKPEVVIRFRNAPAGMQPRDRSAAGPNGGASATPPRGRIVPTYASGAGYGSGPNTPDAAMNTPSPRGSATRNRLQKQPNPNVGPISVPYGSPNAAAAHSSPNLPTMNNMNGGATPSPRGYGQGHAARASASDYPLREHHNYGGGSPSIRSGGGGSSYAGSVYSGHSGHSVRGGEENYNPRPRSGYGSGSESYGRGPPIPAKVPIKGMGMGGGYPVSGAGAGGYDALTDELSRIDIGGGDRVPRRVRVDPRGVYMG